MQSIAAVPIFNGRFHQSLQSSPVRPPIPIMNSTTTPVINPALPPYTLHPLPPLLPFISDAHLLLVLPTIAYWAYGILFYLIDQYDYLPQYRLHTPAEFLKRNHVPVSQVVSNVLIYQAFTAVIGIALSGDADLYGMEEYHIAIWANRLHTVQNFAPAPFRLIGVSTVMDPSDQ